MSFRSLVLALLFGSCLCKSSFAYDMTRCPPNPTEIDTTNLPNLTACDELQADPWKLQECQNEKLSDAQKAYEYNAFMRSCKSADEKNNGNPNLVLHSQKALKDPSVDVGNDVTTRLKKQQQKDSDAPQKDQEYIKQIDREHRKGIVDQTRKDADAQRVADDAIAKQKKIDADRMQRDLDNAKKTHCFSGEFAWSECTNYCRRFYHKISEYYNSTPICNAQDNTCRRDGPIKCWREP